LPGVEFTSFAKRGKWLRMTGCTPPRRAQAITGNAQHPPPKAPFPIARQLSCDRLLDVMEGLPFIREVSIEQIRLPAPGQPETPAVRFNGVSSQAVRRYPGRQDIHACRRRRASLRALHRARICRRKRRLILLTTTRRSSPCCCARRSPVQVDPTRLSAARQRRGTGDRDWRQRARGAARSDDGVPGTPSSWPRYTLLEHSTDPGGHPRAPTTLGDEQYRGTRSR
jgi:hypothetical protein